MLGDDEYHPLPAGADGVLRSQVFPGFWLDTAALLAGDGVRFMAMLREGLHSGKHATFVAQLEARAHPKGSAKAVPEQPA